MSHFKPKMHQIRFPASVRSFVRLVIDGVWNINVVEVDAVSLDAASDDGCWYSVAGVWRNAELSMM